MSNDTKIFINDYSQLKERTSKSGKLRYSIKVTSEPLAFDLDERKLAAPVAAAIAHHLREKIKGITAQASPATIKAREVAARAFAQGKSWALKRYAGGRTGPMAPNQSSALFNDSGRFAETIVAGATKDGSYRINVAANRLSGPDAGRIFERLKQLVPEFAQPSLLLANDFVRRALNEATKGMVTKGRMSQSTTTGWDVARAVYKLVKQVG
jgi:hypothetical protein